MSFVTIDRDKCTLCGDCVDTCLFCFSEKDGEIIVDANEDNCLRCGHCVSICPTDAITHQRLNMDMKKMMKINCTSGFLEFCDA